MSANPLDTLQSYESSKTAVAAAKVRDRPWLDRVGITASVACAIHCIAAPFLLLLLPAAGSIWSDPLVHWVLAALVLPLAVWVIYRGYRKHGKRMTLAAAITGSAFVVAGLIAPMVSTQPLFTTSAPAIVNLVATSAPAQAAMGEPHGEPAPAAASTCSAACCPTVAIEQSSAATPATATLGFPAGGVLTIIGSILLVLAHATNIHACRCWSRHGSAACAH
jgi:hypothetical protein